MLWATNYKKVGNCNLKVKRNIYRKKQGRHWKQKTGGNVNNDWGCNNSDSCFVDHIEGLEKIS